MDPSDPPLVPFPKRKSGHKNSAYHNSRNISDIRSDPSSGLSSPSDKDSTEVSGSLSYAAMAQRQTTAIIVKSDLAAKDVIVMPPKQETGNSHLVSVKKPQSSASNGRGRRTSANTNANNPNNTNGRQTIINKKQINQKSSPAKKQTKVQYPVTQEKKPKEIFEEQVSIVKVDPEVVKPALPSFAQLLRPVAPVARDSVKPVAVSINEQPTKTVQSAAKKTVDKPTDAVEIAQLKAAIVASGSAPTWHTIKVNGKKRTVLQEEPADFWEEKDEITPVKPVVEPIEQKIRLKESSKTINDQDSEEKVPVAPRRPKAKMPKSKKVNIKLDNKSNSEHKKYADTQIEDVWLPSANAQSEDDLSGIEEYNFVTDPEAIFVNAIAPVNIFSSPRSDKSLLSQSGSTGFGGLFASPNFGVQSSFNHTVLRQEEDMVMRIMRSLSSVEPKTSVEQKFEKLLNSDPILINSEEIIICEKNNDDEKKLEKIVDELTNKSDLITKAFLNKEFDVHPLVISDITSIPETEFKCAPVIELENGSQTHSNFTESSEDTLSNGINPINSLDNMSNKIRELEVQTPLEIVTNIRPKTEPKNKLYTASVTNGKSEQAIYTNGTEEHKQNGKENQLENGHNKTNGHSEKLPIKNDFMTNSNQVMTEKVLIYENVVCADIIDDEEKLYTNGNIAKAIDTFPNETMQSHIGCEDKIQQKVIEIGIDKVSTIDISHLSNGKMNGNSHILIEEACIKDDRLSAETEETTSSLDPNDNSECSSELSSMDTDDDDDRTVVGPLDEYIEDVMVDERDSLNVINSGEFYEGDDMVIDPIHDGDIDELIKQAEQIVRLSTDVESWAKTTKGTVSYKEPDRNESPRSSEDSGILENHEESITSPTESESGQSDQYLKFPLTDAVSKWLEEKQKEKSPEPIIRIPEHPILSGQIEKSIQRFQISEMLKSYADDEEDDIDDYEDDDTSSDESVADVKELSNEPSKNLQSNPLPALSADRTYADNIEADTRVAVPQSTNKLINQSLTKDVTRISAQGDPDILDYWENDPMLQAPNRKGYRPIDYAKLLAKVSTKTTIDFMLANTSSSTPQSDSNLTRASSNPHGPTLTSPNVQRSETGCVIM